MTATSPQASLEFIGGVFALTFKGLLKVTTYKVLTHPISTYIIIMNLLQHPVAVILMTHTGVLFYYAFMVKVYSW